MRWWSRSERGASAVEFALIAPMVILLIIGSAEFGLAFRDWLSITSASREGARVGSAAGNHIDADCVILEAVAAALTAVPIENVNGIRVYEVDTAGNPTGLENRYEPLTADNGDSLICDNWATIGPQTWPSISRSVAAGDLDILGVQVRFVHQSVTNLIPALNALWTDSTIMRLEPQVFE